MAQPKQKQSTKSEKNTKKSSAGKKQGESVPTRKKADQPPYRCRPKKGASGSVEISAEQIDPNSPEADAAVMRSLLEMALSGKNITATIFWAKARCGMREKGREKEQSTTKQIPAIVIRAEGKQA